MLLAFVQMKAETFFTNVDGVEWAFNVLSETDKTCEVAQQEGWVSFTGDGIMYYGPAHVVVPSEVNGYKVVALGWQAFEACGMKSVSLPSTITKIGYSAFNGCESMESVNLPEGITDLPQSVFRSCTSLKSLSLPSGLKTIGSEAFTFSGLETIILPSCVTEIPYQCFRGSALRHIVIPETIDVIGEAAFNICSNLESIDIRASITEIPDAMCLGCTVLNNVTIPEGVESIGTSAFCGTQLETLVLPSTLRKIGNDAFYCYYDDYYVTTFRGRYYTLRYIDCKSTTPPEIGNNTFFKATFYYGPHQYTGTPSNSEAVMTLIVPDNCLDAYKATDGWNAFSHIYQQSGNRDGEYLTYFIERERDIKTKASVLEMTFHVLSEQDKTVAVEGKNGLPCMSKTAYSGASLVIPSNICGYRIVRVGDRAFEEVNFLDIELPSTVKEIGSSAFKLSGLQYATLSNQLTVIGDSAFMSSSLKYIEMPRRLLQISRDAFSGCSNLQDIELPTGLEKLGSKAFQGCTSLRYVTSHITDLDNLKVSWIRDYATDDGYVSGNINDVFQDINSECVLRVPRGYRKFYARNNPWKLFAYIEQFDDVSTPEIDTMEDSTDMDFAVSINQTDDLSSLVLNNIYFTLNPETDYYDADEGCIVIGSTVSEEQLAGIDGLSVGDTELEDSFDGIIFRLPAGSGAVSIDSEIGTMRTLCVKIGSAPAVRFSSDGRTIINVVYDIDEPKYVYIYADMTIQNARQRRALTQTSNETIVKLYGMKWDISTNGITSIEKSENNSGKTPTEYYTLDGRRISNLQRGFNVIRMNDGSMRKVIMK